MKSCTTLKTDSYTRYSLLRWGSKTRTLFAESFNGENWSLVFIPYDTGYEEELKTCIRSVIKHENKYIAVTSKRIITSTDGTNWKIVWK